MIRFATRNDTEQLKNIWRHCFHDSEEFIGQFFSSERSKSALLIEDSNQIVSMLFLLPTTWLSAQKRHPFWYVYGCATQPSHRKHGLMECLLTETNSMRKKWNVEGLVLVPANQSLSDYYKKIGFNIPLPLSKQTIKASDPHSIYEISGSRFSINRLRNEQLKNNFFEWDETHLLFAKQMYEPNGGLLRFEGNGTEGYAFYEKTNSQLTIKELISSGNALNNVQFANMLYKQFGVKETILFTKKEPFLEKDSFSYALMRSDLNIAESPYFNLGLD